MAVQESQIRALQTSHDVASAPARAAVLQSGERRLDNAPPQPVQRPLSPVLASSPLLTMEAMMKIDGCVQGLLQEASTDDGVAVAINATADLFIASELMLKAFDGDKDAAEPAFAIHVRDALVRLSVKQRHSIWPLLTRMFTDARDNMPDSEKQCIQSFCQHIQKGLQAAEFAVRTQRQDAERLGEEMLAARRAQVQDAGEDSPDYGEIVRLTPGGPWQVVDRRSDGALVATNPINFAQTVLPPNWPIAE